MEQHWRPNRKISFNRWRDCDRCGHPWPERVQRRQRGAIVCPECFDEPCHEDIKQEGTIEGDVGRKSAPWTPD